MITQNERDIMVVSLILSYCDRINEHLNYFGNDYELFLTNATFQDSVCMSISQIGEHAKRLSEEFTNVHKEIPWNQVRGMRNMLAHQYNDINFVKIWQTVTTDVPALRKFCEDILKSYDE